MSLINFAFLAPLLTIGLVATYWDSKKGIIPNKILLFGFLWGIFLYLLLFLYNSFFVGSEALLNYLFQALLNGIIAVVVGYMIWYFNFWSAGDGKLFGLYGFLVPLDFYSGFYIDYFPAFALLVNLMIPLILLFTIKAAVWIFKSRGKIKNFLLNPHFYSFENFKKYGKTLFLFISTITFAMIIIRSLMEVSESVFGIIPNGFIIFILLLLLMYGINLLRKKTIIADIFKYLAIVLFFGNLIVQGHLEDVFLFARMIIVFAIVIGASKNILSLYIRSEENKKVKVGNLKEGMVLTKEWKRHLSEKISKLTKKRKRESFEDIRTEGLTKEQVEVIKELFKDDDKYEVEIAETLPFSSFMLLAALISVTTYTSFIPLITYFFNSLIYF